MWVPKFLSAGFLFLCLAHLAPVAAQTPPPSVPPLYSREEIDAKLEAIQNEVTALKAVDPYSRADIDTKLEGIRSDLKALQAIPYSKSETDAKVDGLEKTLTGKINALGKLDDDNVKALMERVNAAFWLPVALSILSALLAAFTLWHTSATRNDDRALAAKNRDADLTLAAKKPVKRSTIRYGWFG